MAVVTELVTEFKFNGSTAPLKDFNAGLDSAIGFLTKTVAAVAAVGVAIDAFVIATLHGVESTIQLSKTTGIGIEKIQELGYAASVSGSSVEAMNSTLSSLNQKIGNAAWKGDENFARLGISVRGANGQIKKADQVLDDIGARFRSLKFSMQEKQNFASALGIDPSLVQLLSKTSGEVALLREKARSLGVVTEAQAEEVEKFNASITTLKFGMSSLQTQVAIGLAPAIKELAEYFTDLLATNKELIVDGIKEIVKWFGYFFEMLGRIWPWLVAVGVAFVAVKIAALGLSGVLAILFSPVVLITAAIVAAVLIVDDLIVAFRGGKSVIRDFFLEFFQWDIRPALQAIVDAFKWVVSVIWESFKGFFKYINDSLWGIIDGIKNVGSAIGDFFGIGDTEVNQTKNVIVQPTPLSQQAYNIKPGQASNAISTVKNNSVQQSVTVNIQSSDPDAAGRAVQDSLNEQLEYADIQFEKGGR